MGDYIWWMGRRETHIRYCFFAMIKMFLAHGTSRVIDIAYWGGDCLQNKNDYIEGRKLKNTIIGLVLIAGLGACSGGNPFDENNGAGSSGDGTTGDGQPTGGGTDAGGSDNDGISGIGVPPGTTSPTSSTKIVRYEENTGNDGTDGYVRDVRYIPLDENGDGDTFIVDNLAFDSANVYVRGTDVSSLNGFSVYESTTPFPDSVTNDPISQFGYRAIYGVSRATDADGVPNTQFAIVRSSSFRDYGFGGFIYQRNGTVTLPDTGQATFSGKTAGIRDFEGKGGLEYTTGNLNIDIDFEDFNDVTGTRGDGVKAEWTNRRIFDANGVDITQRIIDNINPGMEAYPTAQLIIRPNSLKDSGDLVGEFESTYVDGSGEIQDYEAGNFYAVVSGDGPDEIAGVIVVTNDTDYENVTTRETAGFIVYRGANN
ncbi:hypothetical protein OS189_00695 [Sulfitobacter sp. F26169L]|uniref:hypothetical protein n=1 Tax=Sulfitobacter sp. F26169L TaxID=2996015 RepID=UPI002260DEB5|nr:hypothetical protein [Sulfitobacter sp. F26169L]MCX7564858.1 hypothetical protein [Sulfitobacter sp. F26169L]